MSEEKVERDTWQRFMRGELERVERLQLVRRILAAAADSEGTLADADGTAASERSAEGRYGDVWLEATGSLGREGQDLAQGQQLAEALFADLRSRPRARQRILICEDPRFHSWPLCTLLLERSWEAGFDQPEEALDLAELAVSVAAELNTHRSVPEPLLCDLKARAWAYLGNARRINSDLRGARKAFELAESLIERGTGDPVEQGRVLELRASLALATHQLDEAEVLLNRAHGLYRRTGSLHLQGRCRVSQGLLWGLREDPSRAVRLLRQGLEQIDPAKEPRLRLVALHNLSLYLTELGEREEALELLDQARQMHQELGNRMDLVRLRWLEGRVALAAERLEEAEAAFLEVRQEFIERKIGYDAALVSLDLAGVYARLGRGAEMRQLAREMIPIFQARDLSREVMAALIVLQKASRMEQDSRRLIQELSSLLESSLTPAEGLPEG